MSALSDFISAGGGGGLKPFIDLGTVTGTITLDYSKNSAYKVTQGAGDLEILLNKDPEIRAEGDLFLDRNASFNLAMDSAFEFDDFKDNVGAYTVGGARYDNVSFSFAGQDTQVNDFAFSNDGTKMFMLGSNYIIYQYSLTTGFAISTASYDSVSFDVSGQDPIPAGFTFSFDGTKMFMVGVSFDAVYQYTLTSGFDLSTASYDNVSFSIEGQDISAQRIKFSNNGTKMFMLGYNTKKVYQYTLTSGFDLSTISYDNVSFDVSGQNQLPQGMALKPDGTKMIVSDVGGDLVSQYSLINGFDLSTASYASTSFNVAADSELPRSVAFNANGTKMFILSDAVDSVNQYSLTVIQRISQYGSNIGIATEAYPYVV